MKKRRDIAMAEVAGQMIIRVTGPLEQDDIRNAATLSAKQMYSASRGAFDIQALDAARIAFHLPANTDDEYDNVLRQHTGGMTWEGFASKLHSDFGAHVGAWLDSTAQKATPRQDLYPGRSQEGRASAAATPSLHMAGMQLGSTATSPREHIKTVGL